MKWPHETPPARCVHWPRTCAEEQRRQSTYSKPCAHCCPSLYRLDQPQQSSPAYQSKQWPENPNDLAGKLAASLKRHSSLVDEEGSDDA